MTREEHLQWAKDRAIEQCEKYSGFAGWVLFKHDMQKHDELKTHVALSLGDEMLKMFFNIANPESLRIFDVPGPLNMKRFIQGFN